MNVFQKRAQQRSSDKFEDSLPIPRIDSSTPLETLEDSDPNQNIFQKHAAKNLKKQEEKYDIFDIATDVGEQVVTKGISGVGGAYGNILSAFGLQLPEGQNILPGQKKVLGEQSKILDKLNRGETPSVGELMMLSDDDILPDVSRLPTSKEIQGGIENITGIGEGKTPIGRVAGRGAEFAGEGAALAAGGKALSILGGAGSAGQTVREVGGPEWLANTIEIGAPLLHGAVSSKLTPTGKAAKDTVQAGRKIGLTENQITPLIQGEGKTSFLSKFARKGSKTKKLFASIKESLGDSYNRIKSAPEAKIKVPNVDQINLRKEFGSIRNELSKTLAPSPDKEAAIKYVEKSLETLRDVDVTPEYLVNFWQDINKSVKWNSITGGKKALTQLKEPILNTLKKVAPELAEDFELTNNLYTKYASISKKLKPDVVESFINKAEFVAGLPSIISIATGNPLPMMALGSEVSIRLLAREMLINPYFQNLSSKLVTNINQASVKGATDLIKQAREYMERKYPDQKWNFLTESVED